MFEVNGLTKIDKIHNKKVFIDKLRIDNQDCLGIIFKDQKTKSTILECIAKINDCDAGSSSLLRSEIFWVDNNFSLLNSRDVFGNIAIGLELKGASKSEIFEKVKSVAKFFEIESYLTNNISELNIYLKKLVKLAQAIVTMPKLLVIDELSYGLNNFKDKNKLINILKKITKTYQIAIITASNDEFVLKNLCTKIAVINDDNVINNCYTVDEFFVKPTDKISHEYIKFCAVKNLPLQIKGNLIATKHEEDNLAAVLFIKFSQDRFDVNQQLGKLIKQNNCKIDIILAVNEVVGGKKIGNIYFTFTAKSENIEEKVTNVIEFFKQQSVFVEALGYVSTNI